MTPRWTETMIWSGSVLCPNCALTWTSPPHSIGQRPIVDRVRTRVGGGTNGVGQSPSELRSLTLYPAELRAQSAERRDIKGVRGAQAAAREYRLCPNGAPTGPQRSSWRRRRAKG